MTEYRGLFCLYIYVCMCVCINSVVNELIFKVKFMFGQSVFKNRMMERNLKEHK